MSGVVASTGLLLLLAQDGEGGTGLLAQLDFVAGTYEIDGESVALGDIIADTGRVEAEGLIVSAATLAATGALADLLLTLNWTVVIEYVLSTPGSRTFKLINLHKASNTFNRRCFLYYNYEEKAGLFENYSDSESWSRNPIYIDGSANDANTKKTAYTRTDERVAVSHLGNAVEEDTTLADPPQDVDTVQLAFYINGSDVGTLGHIRSIAIYPPIPNVDLPALSQLA